MQKLNNISDFVYGGCKKLDDPGKFVDNWIVTQGDPCCLCYEHRPECRLYSDIQLNEGDGENEK